LGGGGGPHTHTPPLAPCPLALFELSWTVWFCLPGVLRPALQTECGFQFTSKLEGMFADLAISKDVMVGFNKVRACGCPSCPLLCAVISHPHPPPSPNVL
jgi:hypothetical protein